MNKIQTEGLQYFTGAISDYLMSLPKSEVLRMLKPYSIVELDRLKYIAILQEDYEVCTIINEIKIMNG